MATVSVRYIVNDVDAAIAFYTEQLGFDEVMHPPRPSRCCRAGTCAWCSARRGAVPGAARRCRTADAAARRLEPLRHRGRRPRQHRGEAAQAGVRFRNDIVTGTGGKQILAEDPSGNPVELFEPILPEAKLG